MTTFDFQTKRGDTADTWRTTLTEADGSAADLSGNLGIVLLLRDRATGARTSWAAVEDDPDPTLGKVRRDFLLGGNLAVGWFDAEWEVTRNDGTKATYPIAGYQLMRVWEDLG
jgi:hypothetical protein